MQNEPEIVKILRSEEEKGFLKNNSSLTSIQTIQLPKIQKKDKQKQQQNNTSIHTNFEKINLLDRTSELVCLTSFSLNPKYIYVNPSYEKILGYKPDDLVGKPVWDFVSPEDKKKFTPLLKKYLATKSKNFFKRQKSKIVENIEFRIKDKKGLWHTVESTANLLENEILFISRDVTNKKLIEKNLIHSKEEVENILDAMADGIRFIDKNFNVTKMNKKMSELTGLPPAEGIGSNCMDMFKSKFCGTQECSLLKSLKEGKPFQREEIRIRKDGKKVPCLDNVTPLKDKCGKIIGIIEDFRDISYIKNAEAEMEIKESAIESSINAIVITDATGIITYVNRSFLDMWNLKSEKDVLGKHIVKFWHKKGKYMKVIDALSNEGGWVGVLDGEKKDGSVFPVQLSATSIKDENDNLVRMMASFVDITEQKKAQEELRKSHKQIEKQNIKLKKLDELKSAFLNVTSHELRTPMSSIKGYVQMLLKNTLGEINKEQENALNVVLRNTDRLDHLIQDILDISRLESGTMKFIPEETDIEKMIKEVQETMQSWADSKNIKIDTKIEAQMPNLDIDQDRVKQVIINFTNNAIKFSPEESKIFIKAQKDGKNIQFSVEDSGRGIPEDKKEKIFNTFYQVDSGMDRKFGGAGLGLAICRGIVLAHGGRIWVESKVGEGSKFKFTIPIDPEVNVEERFKEIDIFGLEGKNIKNEK